MLNLLSWLILGLPVSKSQFAIENWWFVLLVLAVSLILLGLALLILVDGLKSLLSLV